MLAAILCLALAPLSESKLSLHLLDGRFTRGAEAVVSEGPRALKIFDLGADQVRAMRAYKSAYPGGKLVLRIWMRQKYTMQDDPESSARHWFRNYVLPPIAALPEADRKLIDYVEGPNEGDITPTWTNVEEARWFNRFTLELVKEMKSEGLRPLVGNVAVGNPGGDPEEMAARWLAFLPALQAAHAAGGAWGYHGYTVMYSTDLEVEQYFSLRYRMLHAIMTEADPSLADMPLILTEGGVDQSGNAYTSGWAYRGSGQMYEMWLSWYDDRLREDPYVVAVTLFGSGGVESWPSFELEAITPWMAEHLRRHRPGG